MNGCVSTFFSHGMSARIKKPIRKKLFATPNNLRLHPFRIPSGPLAAFLNFTGGSMFLLEGVLRSKPYLVKVVWSTQEPGRM